MALTKEMKLATIKEVEQYFEGTYEEEQMKENLKILSYKELKELRELIYKKLHS